ncbi:MAG: hypothetical protein KF857_07820 [Fimbriimonadaceae bacterium]|nr:hypothetical protein [Fimbriimonadaceae bacterium]
MPLPDGPLWTRRRQLAANGLPLGVLLAGAAWAAHRHRDGATLAESLWAAGAGVFAAWVTTGLFGLWDNGTLKGEMGRRWHEAHGFERSEKYFVGCARPAYRGVLDPHEDVGWLVLSDDRVEFFGSAMKLGLDKASVTRVARRANPHTWLGLGGWVSIEGQVDSAEFRLLVEPREARTLWGNILVARRLTRRLKEWLAT